MNAPVKNLRIADHPVHDQFLGRWSPRAFTAEAMIEKDVLTLLEAARWAPSASNMQPWRFVYGLRGDAGFAAIGDALVPFNRSWADKAAALIVVASKTTVLKDEAEVANASHAFDAGAAWAQLALQAHLNGWIAHAMGGFDHTKLAANLNLPKGYALHAVVAVGRQGNPASLPEMLQSREHPSDRVPMADIARHGSFA
ncbi:MAG: nitroreductase family protein [Paracoccaceae bacterium]